MSTRDRKQKLCKICGLDDKRRISIENEGSKKNKVWTNIADKFNRNNKDIKLTRFTIRNHCINHCFKVTAKVLDFPKESKQEDEEGLSKTEIQSLSDFLDLVVSKVNDDIISGELKPTVAEGVKAAEIKGKIKEDSKFEKELLNFFTQVSAGHGYSN